MSEQRRAGITHAPRIGSRALLVGVAATAIATVVWVVLTAASDGDTTYHLFPLVIGAAATLSARSVAPGPLRIGEAIAGAVVGVAGVVAGWVVLEAIDKWLSATFIGDQSGGVEGETIAFAAVGAVAGLIYAAYWRS